MLSTIGEKIFRLKYAVGTETWEQACLRVSEHVASAGSKWMSEGDLEKRIAEYFDIIYNLAFIPGGRVIANAGTGIKNLMNCFVLPVEDSRTGIYQSLKDAAEIFANGGGCGYNFSQIREEGAKIKSTGGTASGPLSFATLFDQTGEVIQQASRRGAQMLMLNIDHPDIEKFIDFKATPNTRNQRLLEEYDRNLKRVSERLKNTKYYAVLEKTLLDDQLTHFNISVCISDKFMESVVRDSDFPLMGRVEKIETKKIQARDLLKRMATQAWRSGDPGIFFRDRVNEDNMVPYIGEIECTNPCGEVPMIPYESCCLGSVNLMSVYDHVTGKIDFEKLERVVRLGVRMLNDVQEASEAPIENINKITKGLLRLGLGVMGWSDLLANLEIPYDSDEAKKLGEYLSWFISFFGWLESSAIADERGTFPLYDPEKVDMTVVDRVLNSSFNPYTMEVNLMKFRNVAITSIAPTGSIALIAGVNSSIEPFFALAYRRNITEGVGNVAKDFVMEINPILFGKLKKYGLSDEQIEAVREYVVKYGSVQGCDLVPEKLREVFKTAQEISWKDHVDMQASWQNYVSNAVSKTINMPETATVEDIESAYMYMWDKNLKGGTVYRDNSKSFQILNVGKSG